MPITEQHPLQAQSPYSATKIAAEALAVSYHRSFATPVVIARAFNTFGPRQSARAVIPTIVTQLLENGGELRLGALEPTRDFNFVDDTVRGLVSLAAVSAAEGDAVNIGTGHEVSIGDVAAMVADILGLPLSLHATADAA